MNPDLAWLRNQIDSSAESSRNARLSSLATGETQDEIAHLWDDECGREMRVRYLAPIRDYHEKIDVELELQRGKLNDVHSSLEEAGEKRLECVALSDELGDRVGEISSLGRFLDSLAKETGERLRDVAEYASEAERLVSEADRTG